MQKQARKVAWQLPYGDCAFPMAGSSIVRNPTAPSRQPVCLRKSTSHSIVASGSPFEVCLNPDNTLYSRHFLLIDRHFEETTCTHHCEVLTKRYAHHFLQNCSRQTHQKLTGEHGYRHTYIAAGSSAIQRTRWAQVSHT